MTSVHWISLDEHGWISLHEHEEKSVSKITANLNSCLETLKMESSKDHNLHPRERQQQEAAHLGLHLYNGHIHASSYVGQVWLDQSNNIATRVKPRQNVDQFRMVNKCLENPSAGKYLLKNGLHLFSENPPLPVKNEDKSFPLYLLIARYLSELSMLCKRHIKRGFPRTEQNLTGRCKGSVRIKQNIIHNTAKGRKDRLFCQFQTHSIDTPTNQILKAALEQSLRFLRRHFQTTSWDSLWSWAGESSASLREVTLRRIHPSEFQQMQCKGLMKVYKQPLNLARIILRALGNDPNNPPDRYAQVMLPPYAIDMNELFERYCEALLRQKYGNDLWAGYGYEDKNGFKIGNNQGIRPDFLLKKQDKAGGHRGWVLDAKYKFDPRQHFLKEDIAQVCLYARAYRTREKLNLEPQQEPSCLILMYPDPNKEMLRESIKDPLKQMENKNMDEKSEYFDKLYKALVPIPKID